MVGEFLAGVAQRSVYQVLTLMIFGSFVAEKAVVAVATSAAVGVVAVVAAAMAVVAAAMAVVAVAMAVVAVAMVVVALVFAAFEDRSWTVAVVDQSFPGELSAAREISLKQFASLESAGQVGSLFLGAFAPAFGQSPCADL